MIERVKIGFQGPRLGFWVQNPNQSPIASALLLFNSSSPPSASRPSDPIPETQTPKPEKAASLRLRSL